MPDDLLVQLAGLASKHLHVDDDGTLSQFLLSLYRSVEKKLVGERYNAFTSAVEENGGEDFPGVFLREAFDLMEGGELLQHAVKLEPSESVREAGSVELGAKEELPPRVAALSLPNREVKLEEGGTGAGTTRTGIDRGPGVKPEPDSGSFEKRSNREFKRENSHRNTTYAAGDVHRGYVSNITAYGAFIRLDSPTSFVSGLCHVSKMLYDGKTRVRHPEDVVKPNQEVFVKIVLVELQGRRSKIALSMVGVDQVTGVDNLGELDRGRGLERTQTHSAPKRRRLTSPERWEIRQLIASGAVPASDYPEMNMGADDDAEGPDEDSVHVDIELNTDEPDFLRGQAVGAAGVNPLLIIKNPTGTMSRAAMSGSKLAQQAREERIQQQKEAEREARLARESSDPLERAKHSDKVESAISEWRRSQNRQKIDYGKKTTLLLTEQRQALPVYAMRAQLVQAIRDNQFLVVVGETGSGKTTQIVQYVYEEAINVVAGQEKIIGCTQPRRVAAASVAKRVAEEVGCRLGDTVGYYVRFEDVTSPQTRIKYMTDGMLQREALLDPDMLKYLFIMLDEAHERTIATDVLFALLKTAAKKNPQLKVVITSATLDSQKFSTYFNNCPVVHIPGRTYPVEILFSRDPEPDYLAAALDSVMQIHLSEPSGDILVFLTGQDEIDTACEILYKRIKTLGAAVGELLILPVYSALPSEMQLRIFEPAPPGARKVVLATNIAETSITIDGIRYVVDPGFVKINAYDARLGMDLLVVSPISQAQANQRSGRAGRTGPGKCFRLYTEAAYNTEMMPNPVPEIQRQNLALTILMLKAMGINDLLHFEFMDPPPAPTMVNALHELYTLDALDDSGFLTALGRRMAEFPMEPALAKTVLASAELECSAEVLSVVAMLSVQTVFYRPKEKMAAADQRKQRFHSVYGDHMTFLNVFKAWEASGRSLGWCKDNYIHERSMRKAQDVRKQLVSIMARLKLRVESCDDMVSVRKAFCLGFFRNLAKRDPHDGIYTTLVDQTPVHLHPLLALFGKSTEYVMYHTVLLTTKEYMHCVSAIEARWLPELAPRFFRAGDPNNPSERRKREKIVPLFNRFAESQDAWRLTAQVEAKKQALRQLHQ